jgi:hypothetical protein
METVGRALKSGVQRVDIFFMVGLPGQSYEDAVTFDEFCREMLERFDGDRRLEFFIAPLAPFVDPGSSAFERPGDHGFKLRFHSLSEHISALAAPSWKEMLNYETDLMTREEIAGATYEALRRLQRLKLEWNLTDKQAAERALAKIDRSERAVAAVDAAMQMPAGKERDSAVRAAADTQADQASIFQKNYLIWPLIKGRRFASIPSLIVIGVTLLMSEVSIFFTKRLRLYLRRP